MFVFQLIWNWRQLFLAAAFYDSNKLLKRQYLYSFHFLGTKFPHLVAIAAFLSFFERVELYQKIGAEKGRKMSVVSIVIAVRSLCPHLSFVLSFSANGSELCRFLFFGGAFTNFRYTKKGEQMFQSRERVTEHNLYRYRVGGKTRKTAFSLYTKNQFSVIFMSYVRLFPSTR